MVMLMVWCDSLAQNVGMDLTHVGAVTAYGAYISPFLSAFGAGEVFSWEKRGGARRAEKDGICLADVFLQKPLIFAVLGRDNAECQFRIRVA